MKKILLLMLSLIMSVTMWATDPYFEIVSGSFQSGNVTVKATFPDATSVTGVSGAWVYLVYNGDKYWNNGSALYATGSALSFEGNTFTASYSFTCPEGATNDMFTLSPYNNDIIVDRVSQPGTLVISLSENCDHETVTYHKAVASTTTTYGHEAYNQCNACGKLFRTSDTEHATPVTLADLQYPLLRSNPYYEVLDGSFASGNVTLKITFPGAKNVAMPDDGYCALKHPSDGGNYVFNGTTSFDRNTMTISFYGVSVQGDEEKYYVQFWSQNILIDGENPSANPMNIYAKDAQPYAEVIDGSLADGNPTIKITVPYATEITPTTTMPEYYYAKLNYLGNSVASLNMTQVTCSGNTITLPYSFTSSGSKTLNYTIDISLYALKMDGTSHPAMTVYFLGASYDPEVPDVEPGEEPGGEEPGGEEPGGEEPEEPAELANYFWVENLSEDATTVRIINKNIEYSSTPDVADSWTDFEYQVELAAHEKVYLRASVEGNTNMSGAIAVGEVGSTLNGNDEWVPFDTRVPYKVGGDITTLLDAKGNVMDLPAPEGEGYFKRGVFEMFFYDDTYLQDVSELVLPSTTLAESCYASMFHGCTNITTAPILPATVLVNKCYDNMFNGCSNLNYVEVCFSEWLQKSTGYSLYAATENWLQGVASEGTIKTHDWVRNDYRYYDSTYPYAWNRENLTSMKVTVSEIGYTTFYYATNWVMPEGMEGYIAYHKYNSETASYDFIFKKVFDAGEIVSYNQPLILKATAGTYTINFTYDESTRYINEDEDYNFEGSIQTRNLSSEYNSSNYYWYALSLDKNGENAGFYWVKNDGDAFISEPFNAWLKISKTHFNESSVCQGFSFEKAPVVGDVDGNGELELADVKALETLLADPANESNLDYDINGDGKFTIADITALINMLQNK